MGSKTDTLSDKWGTCVFYNDERDNEQHNNKRQQRQQQQDEAGVAEIGTFGNRVSSPSLYKKALA
ncbi:hypothetical protein HanRHA438_Chr05g0247081 [Helianthus annuus]|nr:hypothetical protein HanRHA438_Chr05g0247081 [Helianthus annuus]